MFLTFFTYRCSSQSMPVILWQALVLSKVSKSSFVGLHQHKTLHQPKHPHQPEPKTLIYPSIACPSSSQLRWHVHSSLLFATPCVLSLSLRLMSLRHLAQL